MKKFYALLLIMVFLCNISFCNAAIISDSDNSSYYAKVNEYDLLLNLSNRSRQQLFHEGYSTEEINDIYNLPISYKNYLEQYTDYPDYALKNMGYSQEQITLFRNFTGSEEQLRSLAATLSFSVLIDYVTWSASQNRTNARVTFDFEWSGVPFIKTTDIVALTWNDWTIMGKNCTVTYLFGDGTKTQIGSGTYVENSGPNSFGGGFKFSMVKEDNTYWAKSGFGVFTLYHNYEMHDLSLYGEYGHSTIVTSPTFSIPGYGSIGFSYGTEMAASDHDDRTVKI
ncbi:hypothetical protein [Intestinimonas sp.]|uniref:hypothetical protein n=1 Tax=Intestinimonas sp. TaxID=1965293 RepID=UPI0026365E6C|nr:hypothetical protein [Intestinimonas sp.]